MAAACDRSGISAGRSADAAHSAADSEVRESGPAGGVLSASALRRARAAGGGKRRLHQFSADRGARGGLGGGYRGPKSTALREPPRQHAVYHTRLLPGDGHSAETGTRGGGERRRDGAAGGRGQRVVRAALLAGTECDRTEVSDRLRNSNDCGSGGGTLASPPATPPPPPSP